MLPHLDEILLDHAHCEKKAASTAINMIFRYQDKLELMVPLAQLAQEELEHFEQVLAILNERSIEFKRQVPSPYAGALYEGIRKEEPQRLLDTLLCCGLIEARSCERMKLLSEVLENPLADFYQGLLASEARHYQSYVDLALCYFDKTVVYERLSELAEFEGSIIEKGSELPRLHC